MSLLNVFPILNLPWFNYIYELNIFAHFFKNKRKRKEKYIYIYIKNFFPLSFQQVPAHNRFQWSGKLRLFTQDNN